MRTTAKLALCVAFFSLTGCQRVNYEKTIQVDPLGVQEIVIDAPRSDQKVTVAVSSPGAAVNVYLVLEKDKQAAVEALQADKKPANLLASKEKAEEATVEATVPAKNGYAVLLSSASGKKSDVKVKVTGK